MTPKKSKFLLHRKVQTTEQKFTKASMHLEGQRYPVKSNAHEYADWDDHLAKIKTIDDAQKQRVLIERIEKHDIHVVGIDLYIAEHRALRAVQKLLTETNYQGNFPEKQTHFDGNNAFKFTGNITPLKITIAEYLAAFGVNKKIANDGKARFNSNEREEAVKALVKLSAKMFYFYFTTKHFKRNAAGKLEEKINVIQTVAPLFKLFSMHQNLTPDEFEDLLMSDTRNTKIQYVIIEPSPIMMLDIDSYFMLIPPYENDIRVATDGKRIPKEVYSFVGYLLYQAEIKRSKRQSDWCTITIHLNTLIFKLRLENYFSRTLRNPQKAFDIINKSIEIALKTGYVLEHVSEEQQNNVLHTFTLNPEKFYQKRYALKNVSY